MYYSYTKANKMKNDFFFVAVTALYAGGAIYLLGWDNVVNMIVDLIR